MRECPRRGEQWRSVQDNVRPSPDRARSLGLTEGADACFSCTLPRGMNPAGNGFHDTRSCFGFAYRNDMIEYIFNQYPELWNQSIRELGGPLPEGETSISFERGKLFWRKSSERKRLTACERKRGLPGRKRGARRGRWVVELYNLGSNRGVTIEGGQLEPSMPSLLHVYQCQGQVFADSPNVSVSFPQSQKFKLGIPSGKKKAPRLWVDCMAKMHACMTSCRRPKSIDVEPKKGLC